MRVAHFCDSHAGRSDGVAISVAATVHLLRGAGHDVQLYQPGPLLRGSGEPCGVRSVPVPLRNVRIGLPRFPGMRRVPEVVHIHTPGPVGIGGLRYARAHDIPVVMTWHTDLLAYSAHFMEIQFGAAHAARRLALGWTVRDYLRLARPGTERRAQLVRLGQEFLDRTAILIAPSEKTAASFAEFARVPPVWTVPTPVTLPDSPLGRDELRRSLRLPSGAPVVLAVGRATKEKDPALLLDAFARVLRRLPDARLVMLGVLQQRQAVLRLARRAGVAHALRLVRPVPHAIMAGYYRMADVLAFASTTDTQGLVLAEAEAQGLPVVLADAALAGPHRLSAAPDADTFGAAITRVLTDPSLHRRVAEAGRAAAEAYSTGRHLDHLLRAYRAAQAAQQAHPAQGVASASVGASLAARTAG
ncbi:glycosyltransferase [Dactylosporangium aurantiacum]|uniref:Glycosyltransferase n=1 Tax=Dactylosporangium aurantiacum TaxID=35754 RepID=A0A9Q9IFL3_9ACTN|nr:glycosyltransferase [Dactylosporangium aurantiacum]MDG6108072.1 glycosyltransferase [Dactylosporangium aurantiacum]UWZ53703.1 glycosyltransferase [Dactylosporangium aurantiacum]